MPRPLIVGATLLAALAVTTALLAWLSPSPLTPDIAGRLFISGVSPRDNSAATLERLFQTTVETRSTWKAVYIHHSRTDSGDARTLAELARQRGVFSGPTDHLIIGNGSGAGDGEVQFTPRWELQEPAGTPAPGFRMDPDCISICLIGDFDRIAPTAAQMERLEQVLQAIEQRLGLGAEQVLLLPEAAEPGAGVGRFFPAHRLGVRTSRPAVR